MNIVRSKISHSCNLLKSILALVSIEKINLKILKGTDSPTVDIEIYNKRKQRDCSETIINWQTLERKKKT